jgi:hypothetical protein
MLGHHEQVVKVGAEGHTCHLRVVQVSSCRFKLLACPTARKYLSLCDLSPVLNSAQSPTQVLDCLEEKILEQTRPKYAFQNASINQVLEEISMIGFNNIKSFDSGSLTLRGSSDTSVDIKISLKSPLEVPLHTVYNQLLDEQKVRDRLVESTQTLRSLFYITYDNDEQLQKDTSVLLYLGCGESVLVKCDSGGYRFEINGHSVENNRRVLLEKLQELFPNSRIPTKPDSSDGQCVVCQLIQDNDVPDVGCVVCKTAYHHRCLLDWLQNCPSSSRAFGYISGQCVVCECELKIKI